MYIGNDLQVAESGNKIIDDISSSFNGSTTSFALLVGGAAPVPFPINTQQIYISVNGVIQEPDPTGSAGFKLLGNNIVFSSAPANGHAFFGVILSGADYVTVGTEFPAGSATAPSITFGNDNNTGLYSVTGGTMGFTSDGVQTFTLDGDGFTLPDNKKLFLGSSSDLQLFHDGSNSYIKDVGTGNLFIDSDGASVAITSQGATENMGIFAVNGAVDLYYNNTKRFETTNTGTNVIGVHVDDGATHDGDVTFTGAAANVVWDKSADDLIFNDNAKAAFGTSSDLTIYHDGSDSYLADTGTGNLNLLSSKAQILNAAGNEAMAKFIADGAVELYHNNVKTFETTSGGNKSIKAGQNDFILGSSDAGGVYLLLDGDSNGDASGSDYSYIAHDTSGNLQIAADNPAGNAAVIFSSGTGTAAMRIDSTGRLLIGTASNQHNGGDLLQVAAESSAASLSLNRYTANAHPSYINFFKSRNASLSGQTVVQDGDTLGLLAFYGSDGSDRALGAEICAQVDGSPGSDDMPSRLVFRTSADGSQSPTERMRIDSSGRVMIGTSTEGHADTDDLTIAGSAHTGITIRSGENHSGSIYFSDATSGAGEYKGYIQYDQQNDNLRLGCDSDTVLWLHADKKLSVGEDSTGYGQWFFSNRGSSGADATGGDRGLVVYSDTGYTNNTVLSNDDWTLKLANGAYAGTGVSGNTGTVVKLLFNGATSNGWNAYGAVGLDVQGTSGGKGDLFFNTGGTTDGNERMRIKYTGNIGIGESAPDCKLHVNAGSADDALKLESTDNAVNLILTDAACYSSIQQNNDMLNINSDPGSTVSASTIRFNIDGVNVGTFLNNQFRLGSNSAGLQFNGDTAAANALDDYEEGTWTPAATSGTFTTATGTYTKIGRKVTALFVVEVHTTTSGNYMQLNGLPFVNGGNAGENMGSITYNETGNVMRMYVSGGGTAVLFWNDSTSFFTYANCSGDRVRGGVTYFV